MWPSLRWPVLRQLSLRHGVVVLSLVVVGCVGLAAAAGLVQRGIGESAEAFQLDDETTGSVGPFRGLGSFARAALPLSDEERFHIYEGVMRMPDAPDTNAPTAEIADALPSEVPLRDLPTSVIRQVPLVEGHQFVKFDDRILVVNPASRIVVAMIPRYKLLQ
ncbi:MAG TPA: hypothetical protein VKD43_14935 [Xanthobacteraceae bacterium]|nr:hypothetical protein [Xanthobacteraceae bacterium]